MTIEVRWRRVNDDHDPAWRWNRCLYAYRHPRSGRILYLGKADGASVHGRFNASDKAALRRHLVRRVGVDRIGLVVGALALKDSRRLTRQLMADIESLLIHEVQPVGNVQGKRSRINRPGMRVKCSGAWPERRRVFVDAEDPADWGY